MQGHFRLSKNVFLKQSGPRLRWEGRDSHGHGQEKIQEIFKRKFEKIGGCDKFS